MKAPIADTNTRQLKVARQIQKICRKFSGKKEWLYTEEP